jgi:lipid-binding SYLF domain-containing protein
MKRVYFIAWIAMLAMMGSLAQAAVAPKTPQAKEDLHNKVQAALSQMQEKDPGVKDWTNKAWGYAIYPAVKKGGLIIGGAHGKGEAYRQGNMVGYTDLSQGSFGLQAGGKEYAELVLFENADAFNRFTKGDYSLGANASAIAIKSGASAAVHFQDGVAVMTMPEKGLMAEVSISGQKLSFEASEAHPAK